MGGLERWSYTLTPLRQHLISICTSEIKLYVRVQNKAILKFLQTQKRAA